MKHFPQLKLRTEFTFRQTFAPVSRVAERLEELGARFGGIVDPNCWGHVRWQTALAETKVQPGYGMSFAVDRDDERRPEAWMLAEDTKRFYNFASAGIFTDESLAAAQGIVRFAGAALDDPETFDYIDLNPASAWATRRSLDLHKRTKKPLVVTCDNWHAFESDRGEFLAITDNKMITPQWILSEKEIKQYAPWIPAKAFKGTHEVAERLAGIELAKAPMIEIPNASAELKKLVAAGKKRRIAEGLKWTPEYTARVKREMDLIKQKQYESYFVVVADLVNWAKGEMLVGPARGSSAGSLVCYLTRITEVDPLVHGLLFERFIDLNRADLPDIDIDFSDQRRHLVFEYLAKKYGEQNVARLGNVSNLRSRSVIYECGKRLAIPANKTFGVKNVLIEYSSGDSRYGKGLEDTLENTGPGQDFMREFPHAKYMTAAENHAWHTSVHAAGVLVSNEPITDYCCVRDGVTQLDKIDSEKLNLLKIDALGLRTLGIIEDANVMPGDDFYTLPLTDQKAFDVINNHRFAGVFQFEGTSQRRVSMLIPIESFRALDHITALARPGPLGGGAATDYTDIVNGRKQPYYQHESMKEYLGDTNGVVLYQEQVMRIVRELGGFSWEETSTIRKAMSARKGIEYFNRQEKQFVKGAAARGVSKEDAIHIWKDICGFGAWGMNASHTCSYAIISYWCAWMKAYHPIEFAAALLRSAKDDEQTIEVLREITSEGVPYVPFDAEKSRENWMAIDGTLYGGFQCLHGIGPAKATVMIKHRDEEGGLTEKDLETIEKCELKFTKLFEAREMWEPLYDDPEAHNVRGPIKEFGDLEDFEDACVICKLIRKERRDENEAVRINRRGERWKGQPLFLDCQVVDDSVSKPITMRVKTHKWFSHGIPIADKAIDGEDWFLVRGRWLGQFNMLLVNKIRCLTNTEMFS